MPTICAIATCRNNFQKTGKEVSYFRFPKDTLLRKKWIHECKRQDKVLNPDNARICSAHFQDSDYERNLQAEVLGYAPSRKLLKKDAYPTLNLPGSLIAASSSRILSPNVVTNSPAVKNSPVSNNDSCTYVPVTEEYTSGDASRQSRANKRSILKRAFNTIEKLSPKKHNFDKGINTDIQYECSRYVQFQRESKSCRLKVKKLLMHSKANDSQAKVMREKISELQIENRQLKEQLRKKATCTTKLVQQKMERVCHGVLSKTQINVLVNGRKKGRWTKDDIAKALTLRSISRRAYQYRRKTGEPQPGLSTLRRWTKFFQCKQGLMHDVIHLMQSASKSLQQNERIAILSFDEMNIDSRLCYDQSEDRVFGPHRNVQVVMVRGLFSKWKQPIFYDFDVSMSSSILKEIIISLEKIDYQIVGVVSDMGAKNNKVWNELRVSYINISFPNPCENSRIVWVFADIPHLLKLLRNHILDDGITLLSGKKISKEIFSALLEKDSGETRICPHITYHHIHLTGRDRQNVRLAAQLLSRRTATALQYALNDEEASNFVLLVNDTFDVLNSRISVDFNTKLCSAFGTYKEDQLNVINKFASVCAKMAVGKSKHLLPFQKGFLQSIRSAKGLYHDLVTGKETCILTSRLNQDCLENLFSQLRGLGHFYDNPSPIEVKHCLRLLLLGANSEHIQLGSSTTPVQIEDSSQNWIRAC